MDTRTAKIDVAAEIQVIKQHMPETYKSIQAKAAQIGNEAYVLVRRGLRGEPNCFWAMERGYVKGALFNLPDVQRDVAWAMVGWGCAYVCIFAQVASQSQGEANGTH